MTDHSFTIAETRVTRALTALNEAQALYDYFPSRTTMRRLEAATGEWIAAQHVKATAHADVQLGDK